MPRRPTPHPLAVAVGRRVSLFRGRRGLTREKLVHEAGVSSSGHISDLERGRLLPTIATLEALAGQLRVLLADLVIDPARSPRERLIALTLDLPEDEIKRLIEQIERAWPQPPPTPIEP